MASTAKFQYCVPKYNLQINLVRTAPQTLSFPRFFRDQAKSTPVVVAIRASSSSSSPSNPKRSLLKTTFITLTAAAAVALLSASSFHFRITKPAATTTPVTTVLETTLEKHLETHSNDVEALVSLAKIKFESDKCEQVVEIMNRLIEVEPYEQKWPVMKARILSFFCKNKLAIEAFEEILSTDPIRVDALHYLVMEYYDSKPKLLEAEKRIKYAIRRCKDMKNKNKTKEIRGLRMLIAQIRVLEGNTVEAIRICEELVKEDPEDYKVYLFEGLVYTLLKKEDEAKKQFEKVARILPENHWYLDTPMDKKEWGAMEAYDNVFCYLATFSRLFVASFFFGKFV